MAKIVYNNCYGGFCLSREAVLRAREISGDPRWGGPTIAGDVYNSGGSVNKDYGFIEGVSRHDPVLVRVVEELGKSASGRSAALELVELPSGTSYRIEEYDGLERIECNYDGYWSIAP